jgi:hypothetical protein
LIYQEVNARRTNIIGRRGPCSRDVVGGHSPRPTNIGAASSLVRRRRSSLSVAVLAWTVRRRMRRNRVAALILSRSVVALLSDTAMMIAWRALNDAGENAV